MVHLKSTLKVFQNLHNAPLVVKLLVSGQNQEEESCILHHKLYLPNQPTPPLAIPNLGQSWDPAQWEEMLQLSQSGSTAAFSTATRWPCSHCNAWNLVREPLCGQCGAHRPKPGDA
jgi:hypothetical protein